MKPSVLWLAVAISAAACTRYASVAPVAPEPGGVLDDAEGAAAYELPTLEGEQRGNVKVYSTTVYEPAATDITTIAVTFRVLNDSDEPLALQQLSLNATTDEGDFRNVLPSDRSGPSAVHPRSHAEIDVYFTLPPHISPADVEHFEVGWKLESDEIDYERVTPFVVDADSPTTRWRFDTRPSGL